MVEDGRTRRPLRAEARPPTADGAIFPVMTDTSGPAELAEQIAAARDRLLAFAAGCTDEVWHSTPLASQGDFRPVGVIVDHVAHAYEYMAGWMQEILAGATPAVDVALVDRLNAAHSGTASHLTQAGAMEHLTRSGDEIIALITGLAGTDLEAGGGRVRRFAEIAARHPDTHRTDIEEALRGSAV
jgi:DinB superfamily